MDRQEGFDAQGWEPFDAQEYLKQYRNEVIEDIALEMEALAVAFGTDTASSFATFVRGFKE
jgi:hypothetical protein